MSGGATGSRRKERERKRSGGGGPRSAGASEGERKGIGTLGPSWITAVAGLITAIVGALALWGIGASGTNAQVQIDEARRTQTLLIVTGTYAGLDPRASVVVLLREPGSAGAPWATQRAERDEGGAAAESEGSWETRIPVDARAYEVIAVIVPAPRSGGFESSFFDALRESGPEAEFVETTSEMVMVGD